MTFRAEEDMGKINMFPQRWIELYLDYNEYVTNNKGRNVQCRNFSFIKIRNKNADYPRLRSLLKEVIEESSDKDKELNEYSLKKLKIIVVDENGFKAISELELRGDSKYDYVIFISKDFATDTDDKVKHKIAHEIAHFLFALQEKDLGDSEEAECNKKATEWGFPEPENK